MDNNNTSGNENSRKRVLVPQVTFIRAVCTLGIVWYHFCSYTKSSAIRSSLWKYTNGSWGPTLVTVFFIISGMVLYINYPHINSLSKFYYKRWRSIMPVFYIGYLFYYSEHVFYFRKLFYKGNPLRLLWSVVGMDGYVDYRFETYYCIGQWFLGALILLYIIYPVIIRVVEGRKLYYYYAVLFLAYIFILNTDYFIIRDNRNLITCMLSFSTGIVLARNKDIIEQKYVGLLSIVIIAVLLFIKMPINTTFSDNLFGLAWFLLLYQIANVAFRFEHLERFISFISGISFSIFLVQHRTILRVLDVYNPTSLRSGFVQLCIAMALSIVFGWALDAVAKALLRTAAFKRMDTLFLSK